MAAARNNGTSPKSAPRDELELEPDLDLVTPEPAPLYEDDLGAEEEAEAPPRPAALEATLTAGPTLDGAKQIKPEAQFGFHEEEAIVSLALDLPEFFTTMVHLIRPEYFARLETRYVMAWVLNLNERYNVIPTRGLLKDHLVRQLTSDDPYEDVLAIVDRKSNPREVPLVRDRLKDWARVRAYGLLYNEETILAYQRGDLNRLEEIFKQAARINDTGYRGFWFFDQVEQLLDPDNVIHLRTGWRKLDRILNDGGPSPGEVLIWLAATNVGKSIMLCNDSINSVLAGYNTLHITFEMSALKTARRCLGALTEVPIKDFPEHKSLIRTRCGGLYATTKAQLAIYEMSPDSCTVEDVRNLLTMLRRTRGFSPTIVCLDYLELMLSRNNFYNRDPYVRQKGVATEVCGFAKEEGVFVYSATQTNRTGTGATNSDNDNPIELNKMAESYGKSMPPDYVISLNQSKREYEATPPQIRMFIAKNREGKKFETITCNVNYGNMKVREASL